MRVGMAALFTVDMALGQIGIEERNEIMVGQMVEPFRHKVRIEFRISHPSNPNILAGKSKIKTAGIGHALYPYLLAS